MSMMGRFVQVAPNRLAEIIEDPEQVESLLHGGDSAGGAGAGISAGPIGDITQMLARAPKLLEASMKVMDPKMKEMLKKRLADMGINTDVMTTGGKDAEAFAKLMVERGRAMAATMQSRQAQTAPAGPGKTSAGAEISVDKAWHGIHYLLCGAVEPGATLASQAVMGGVEVGEDLGYGPARYFDVDKVKAIAQELSRANLEAEMIARFDPAAMERVGIYPSGFQANDRDWLMDEFRRLRQFYVDASAAKLAVVAVLE
jgi:hypothetical protein